MTNLRTTLFSALFVGSVAVTCAPGCGSDDNGDGDDFQRADSGPTNTADARPVADAKPTADAAPAKCSPPANLGRGMEWVRENPMMISGLAVHMGPPSQTAVDEYYEDFNANTVHLWQSGLPNEIAGWNEAGRDDFRYVAWVDSAGKSSAPDHLEVIGGVDPLPGRIGYQIGDEPQSESDLNAIKLGAAMVKTEDPDGLRIINLNDSGDAYDLRGDAAKLVDIDILSYDHYEYGFDCTVPQLCDDGVYLGLMDTRKAALAAGAPTFQGGKPYWRYMQSFFYKEDGAGSDETDLRWDAFIGAVYGFTGYSWFVYDIDAANQDVAPLLFEEGGDYAATKTDRYAMVAELNRQLANIGKSLVLLRSADVRYMPITSGANRSGLEEWSSSDAASDPDPFLADVSLSGAEALIGFFRDDCDESYVMIQNQDHSHGDAPNSDNDTGELTLDFNFAGNTDAQLDKGYILSLDPVNGEVTPLKLTSTGTNTAEIKVDLAAGDILFFKYKNSFPFAMQE